jgi:hypothetical protein
MCAAATCAAFLPLRPVALLRPFLPLRPTAPEAAPPGNCFACVRSQTHTLRRSCSAPRKQVFHSRSRAGARHRPSSSSSSIFHSPSTIAPAAPVLFHAAACGVAGMGHAVRIRLRQRWVKVPVAWYGPDRAPTSPVSKRRTSRSRRERARLRCVALPACNSNTVTVMSQLLATVHAPPSISEILCADCTVAEVRKPETTNQAKHRRVDKRNWREILVPTETGPAFSHCIVFT